MIQIPTLTLVTHFPYASEDFPKQTEEEYMDYLHTLIKQGLRCIQIRQKNFNKAELVNFGKKIQTVINNTTTDKVFLIINDHIDVCLELNADGVHLGQTDTNVTIARKYLSNKIIGLSTNNLEQIKKANALEIDYIGVGAIFPTKNKPNIENIWGIDNLKKAAEISKFPIIAIGGINYTNIQSIMFTLDHKNSYAQGVACIEGLHIPQEANKLIKFFIT